MHHIVLRDAEDNYQGYLKSISVASDKITSTMDINKAKKYRGINKVLMKDISNIDKLTSGNLQGYYV